MNYFHLVYYSKAIPELTPDDLSKILVTSRRENLKNDITGFLIYRDNFFLQLLEGTEAAVKQTLARIMDDTRHSSLTVIGVCKSDSRIVPDWNMALIDSKTLSASAQSLIDLFDVARSNKIFDSKEALELVLRKFSKDAKEFIEQ